MRHHTSSKEESFNFTNRPLPMQTVVGLNAPPNTPVFTLQANDPDTDHTIHYFLESFFLNIRKSSIFSVDTDCVCMSVLHWTNLKMLL